MSSGGLHPCRGARHDGPPLWGDLRGLAAIPLGIAYGTCLVSGLRETERLAPPGERGVSIAIFLALTYLGFGALYLFDLLAGLLGVTATLTIGVGFASATALWIWAQSGTGGKGPGRALSGAG